jgi:hypothetical protein
LESVLHVVSSRNDAVVCADFGLYDVNGNPAEVTTAVAKGDLSKKIAVDAKCEILELKNTI